MLRARAWRGPEANRLLGLAVLAALWLVRLGPLRGADLRLTVLPGWTLRLDALSLIFITIALLPPPGGAPALDDARAPRRRLPRLAWQLCALGLVWTAISGETSGQMSGLALATAGIALAAWPAGWAQGLAPILLLPVALAGVFDATPLPGRPIPTLAWPWVALALAAVILGGNAWPVARRPWVPLRRHATPTSERGEWLAALYTAACFVPLMRSLGAGAWDGWARLAVLAAGLLTLGVAGLSGATASDTPGVSRATRRALAGALLLGLGVGTPGALAGGLALLPAGLAGLALAGAGRYPRLVGLGALAGLPPTAAFLGLWLLLGATSGARLPLGSVALIVALAVTALAWLRLERAGRPAGPSAWLLATALLVGGLLPEALLDAALRPALNTLAAGVPALAEAQAWPGVGLVLERANATTGLWPATGIGAAVLLALALAEGGARLAALRRTRRARAPEPPAGP
jgi:hypothetical protein